MKAPISMTTWFAFFFLMVFSAAAQTGAPAVAGGGGCPLASRTVIGAPYSGLEEAVRSQTLADGTHIERKGPEMQYYRDSQGRTRTEHFATLGPSGAEEKFVSNVMIVDPVECVIYNLHVADRVAGRRVYSASGAGEARPPKENPTGPTALTPRPVPEELQPKHSSEQIGTDTIEGLAVEGRRTSTTFPVGSMGNDRPIVSVHEVWTSPELKIPILEKTSDPRSGENTRRLTNIQRVEPDPALFRVPSDYKIKEE